MWHQGLVLKLLQKIPHNYMVRFLSNILANRSFVLKTSDGQSSRPRRLRNRIRQGSCLSPMLFNIYISDIHKTKSCQYGYADDLALCYSHKSRQMVKEALTSDMILITEYLRTWILKLSLAKTTITPFHPNNRESKRQLSVHLDGTPLPHRSSDTYVGMKLDRQLTYKQHTDALRAKLTSQNNLLRYLAGSSWSASTNTLRTISLALV